ncbi:hypothetical protein ACFO5K_08020 [Nocardia halotolerans]|uniref:Uncharacterized protein n=1 Tax=Nocardia halotolerans TaxID=1755878 RepID=A0ABV8VG71_9NOCA
MTGSGVRARAWVAGYCALLTLIIVGPLTGSGYLLLRDAVSTPRSYLTDSALGLGAAAPRAVPQDTLLAVLSPLIDGGVLVKAILIVALWSAAYGAAVLARRLLDASTGAQLVAATVALWNPFVAERLLQGHWSLLAGYAALPWTVLAAVRIRSVSEAVEDATERPRADDARPPADDARPGTDGGRPGTDDARARAVGARPGTDDGRPRTDDARARAVGARARAVGGRAGAVGGWAALTASFAAAGLTPTGSLLAAIVGLALVGRRALLPALVLWVATCAPWLTATALGSGAEPSDPAGVSAFAARAEPWLGTLGSLAGLGGIWNSEAVPASRTTPLALVGTVLLLGIVALGVRAVWARGQVGRVLLVIAAVSIVLPALGATDAGIAAGEWLMVHVPGAGLLRDTQKYVALAMPAYALCAAAACRTLAARLHRFTRQPDEAASTERTPAQAAIATAFLALLILPLADLAWGVGGALRPVHYPAGWAEVVERVDAPGDVAVLPAGMFRRFPYSGPAPVLDPAPRILPNDVLQTGELRVRGYAVNGEGNRARTVETALLNGAPPTDLAALGVGWILVERTTPGSLGDSEATLTAAELRYEDPHLALYRIPSPTPTDIATPTQRHTSTAAHTLWALLLTTGLTTAALRPTRH